MPNIKELKEYRVVWQGCPHVSYPRKVLFVEAESDVAARAFANDQIERTTGISWKVIHEVAEYQRPVGRVISE